MISNAELMLMAVQAGDKARYHAPPNPWVGALVVGEHGVVIAEGHTQVPGEAHAEIVALAARASGRRGATLVVTLEPCCHVGRTGPCTEAIIEAGHLASDRRHRSTRTRECRVEGIALLRASGVDVEVGIEEDVVRAQLAPYLWHRVTGRPYVVAKLPRTLDGVVAMADGTSQVDHRRARRGATRTSCARRARPSSWAPAPCAVTTPQLTARLDDIVLEPLARGAGSRRRRTRSVRPCLERTRRPAVSSSTNWPTTTCSRCSSRAAPRP